MEADKIKVGQTYTCESPLLKKSFKGTVEKIYDLSVLVDVDEFEDTDAKKVDDLNGRLVIPFYSVNPS